jgi:hypothetical protein
MPSHPEEGSPFFQLARRTIQQANFAINQHPEEQHRIEGHYERINQLLSCLLRLQASPIQPNAELTEWISTSSEILAALRQRLDEMQTYDYDQSEDDIVTEPIIPVFQLPTGGRPRYGIPWNIVTVYREAGHTWKEIAKLMGVSDDTLYRRRKEENILDPMPYSTITNAELDPLIKNIIQQTAGVVGVTYILAICSDMGLRVQRQRIRDSVSRIDPVGNFDRWAAVIPRLVYSVPGPNYLWHMDGNLKLVMYGLVLHGAIDGYSRYIIYLEANVNNRAPTVLEAFKRGVERVGQIPERVRADKGGENRDVALWMLMTRGQHSGCFITGRSVHNQRIERLWREVNRWLTPFHLIFQRLHQSNLYDPKDPVDKFTLILVYLPIIRRMLNLFIRVWNKHKLRTEHHKTPTQLYLTSSQNLETIQQEQNMDMDPEIYGVDWDGPLPTDNLDEAGGVSVEPPEIHIQEYDLTEFSRVYQSTLERIFQENEFDWMLSRYNYAVDMYAETRVWIREHLMKDDLD